MSAPHRPRRGSIAYSPRKRARSEIPRVRSWPAGKAEPRLLGFAGYKAGMTHLIMIDDRPHTPTTGMEISVPATIVEVPAMRVAAVRAYGRTLLNGSAPIAEAWTNDLDEDMKRAITIPGKLDTGVGIDKIKVLINEGSVTDLRLITYTTPDKVTGIPKKEPDIMEWSLSGKDYAAKLAYAQSMMGKAVNISDVFAAGEYVDIIAITKGKGKQGPVKRWGINLMKTKHSRAGSLRQVGNLGPHTPTRISWRVPQFGQTGYHQRTDFNKRILQIGQDGAAITPDGGFLNYGIVRNPYVVIKGSIPGPSKRLVRFRTAVRGKAKEQKVPDIRHISLESKQG